MVESLIAAEPTDEQKLLMNSSFAQDNVSKAATVGIIGMFGQSDKYYFWF